LAKEKGIRLSKENLKGIGITNQRETTVLWDPKTGKPLHNAIVWSDKRTTNVVDHLISKYGSQDYFRPTCGLPLSTYFSATKIKWLMDTFPSINSAVNSENCLFGTVDTWLIWNLTGGTSGGLHLTDVTNASRTMFFDLKKADWDPAIAEAFSIPLSLLPKIKSSSEHFGNLIFPKNWNLSQLSGIPISGCLGDQQSALLGQQCLSPGDTKTTYGTGCFMLFNTGGTPVPSVRGLLTTMAYRLGPTAPLVYALEGSVAVAGSGIDWLRDNMGIIKEAEELDPLLASVPSSAGVYFVPAFGGLFAPYWRADATGTIVGLSLHSTKAHIARAFVMAVCFQTMEVLRACEEDSGVKIHKLSVDGGMTASNQLLQIQSDILNLPVVRPVNTETTAWGAAIAAALSVGMWTPEQVSSLGPKKSRPTLFSPRISPEERAEIIKGWKRAARLSFAE